LKPLSNGCLGIIIKINLTTNYQLLLNCNKVHRANIALSKNLFIGNHATKLYVLLFCISFFWQIQNKNRKSKCTTWGHITSKTR
jgi:hypothetical protein